MNSGLYKNPKCAPLSIITSLREMADNEDAVKQIANNYLAVSKTYDEALRKASRNIDEVIDAFNAIEEFVYEIDNKNRNYINSTIGKVKFLLSEEDNVVGKLNTILKFVKNQAKKNKTDKALRIVEGLYDFRNQKSLSMDSLYTPRGGYQRNYNQILDDAGVEFEFTPEFLEQFKTSYNEETIEKFMNYYMRDGVMQASNLVEYDSPDDLILNVVYSVILAVDRGYKVEILSDIIDHQKYIFKDFIIRKGEK